MLLEPDILLMDEPTKGLDAEFKQSFAAMVRSLLSGGGTVPPIPAMTSSAVTAWSSSPRAMRSAEVV